jgi:hypothetical protein
MNYFRWLAVLFFALALDLPIEACIFGILIGFVIYLAIRDLARSLDILDRDKRS